MKRNRQVVQDRRENKRTARGRQVTERGLQEYEKVTFIHRVNPIGEFQHDLVETMEERDAVFVVAPAGSGKTFVVMSYVADWLKKNDVKKIILTRPSVGMGKSLGMLPGSLREKFEPYLMPLVDVLVNRYGREFYETQLNNKNIEFVPLEYIRGRSFDNAVIICDEAQNTTPDEIYSIMTRLGENSKLFFLGDNTQNDLRGETGLEWAVDFIDRHKLYEFAGIVEGTSDDIVRSGFCKAVVKAKEADMRNKGGK